MSIGQLYEKAWKTIISPFKVKHKLSSLGASEQTLEGRFIKRVEIEFTSIRGKMLSGFMSYCPDSEQNDLIVYLHGNGGCKTDAVDLIQTVGKYEVSVAAFDFAGCGNSEDDYLTYGLNECHDLGLFLNAVYKIIKPKSLTIWGRSMGAVTAIMFAEQHSERIDGLVLDGPFRSLATIIQRASCEASHLPKPIIQAFLYFVRRKVDAELNLEFSLFGLDYLDIFRRIPPHLSILFIFSHYDQIVPTAEIFEFYNCYRGSKQTLEIFDAHDEDRKSTLFVEVVRWLKRTHKLKGSKQLPLSSFQQRASTVLHNGCC